MSQFESFPLPPASSLQQVIGALLFGADRPLSIADIRGCLREVAEVRTEKNDTTAMLFAESSSDDIRDALETLKKELSRLALGFELVEINHAFRLQSQACCGPWVRQILKTGQPSRLSRPALETLAVIAYRQPVVKSEIEAIRGVTVDHILKTLLELHLVRIVSRSELPGRPFLYGTTTTFLEHFGLRTIKELDVLDPTLQRSKPSERQAQHSKKQPPAPAEKQRCLPAH